MRGLVVCVVLALLIAALFALQGLGIFADDAPPSAPSSAPSSANAVANGAPAISGAANTPPLGAGLVATRSERVDPPNPNLADAPTAWIRVVEHGSGRAIAGAPIRRMQTGTELAFTDENGLAAVALREPEQLAVVVDGYLLRLVPTRLGSTEAEPQVAQLVRDTWSLVRRVEFTSDGEAPGEVFVRFRPREGSKPGPVPVPQEDAVAMRAWNEHVMLAARPVCADVPVQLGTYEPDRVHRLANGTDVRFLGPGEFAVEAATTGGLVGRADLRVDAAPRTGAPALRIALAPGAFVRGTVGAAGDPRGLGGATITVQGGEPLGLRATSSPDGAFHLGPLLPQRVTLLVRHGDHEPLAFGPVQAPADDVRLLLQPLPKSTLRGRVRTRPTGKPIAGAFVSWAPTGSAPVTATTDADGAFVLRATGDADARLAVQALGHLPYAELVKPGAPFADYDLWPATTPERLASGVSAVLEGSVVDAEGRPVADAAVRWQPAARPAAAGVPGRRVLEGGALELPLGARTGADGVFRLETNAFGPGRLSLADAPAIGVDATATAGQTFAGVRLQR